LKLTLVKSIGLTIPLTIVAAFVNLTAVWVAIAVANVLAALFAGNVLNKWLAKNESQLAGHAIWKDYLGDLKLFVHFFKRL
jgi:uncharacterized membrane protein